MPPLCFQLVNKLASFLLRIVVILDCVGTGGQNLFSLLEVASQSFTLILVSSYLAYTPIMAGLISPWAPGSACEWDMTYSLGFDTISGWSR